MIIKFKVLPSKENKWLGWFGEDVIKVRLKIDDHSDLSLALLNYLQEDLGIKQDKIKIIKIDKDFITLELPDIAWELFLTIVE